MVSIHKFRVYKTMSRPRVDESSERDFKMILTMLWDAWDMNNFYFLFLLFSDLIGILFSFFFFFWTMKRHVTLQSHDMSHDVTS